MSFDNFSSSVKLNTFNVYKNVNTSFNNPFKNTFYSDVEQIDYSDYTQPNSDAINLQKGLDTPLEESSDSAKSAAWNKLLDIAETTGATAVTFFASAVEGIADVGESIVDGAVQVVGGIVSYIVKQFDEDAGNAMQEDIQEFVSTDWTGKGYDAFVNAVGIEEEIAYGFAHTAGNLVGQVAGYAAISMIPGAGPALTAAIGGSAAAGSAAEAAYANGATFDEAMIVSSTAFAAGAFAGAASNQVGTLAKGATTLKGVAGYTASGAAVGMAEPLINSTVEYLTYGNNDGQSYSEFMKETGGWQKVAMGAAAGGISTGRQAYEGYKLQNDLEYKAARLGPVAPREMREIEINGQKVKTNLADEELIAFANDFFGVKPPITSLDDYPNWGVIEDVSSIKMENDKITVDWVPDQGAVPGTRKNTIITANSEIDRYGAPNGCFYGKMEVDTQGNYVGVDYDMRSLPYVEGTQQYTKAKVIKDISSDSLSQSMTDLKATDPDFYKEITIQMKKDGFKYIEAPDGTVRVEVNEAKIAPAYGHNGKGTQYELPIRSDYLADPRMGFLKYV